MTLSAAPLVRSFSASFLMLVACGGEAPEVGADGSAGAGGSGLAAGGSAGVSGAAGVGAASAGSGGGGATAGEPPVQAGGAGSAGAANSAGSGGAAPTGGTGGSEEPLDPFLVNAHFTNATPGTYERADVEADFRVAPPWDNGLAAGRASIVAEGDQKFLRVIYPNAKYGPTDGGVQFVVDLRGSYEELYFSYRVRFQAGFSFNMGGKLPGLVGGSSPTGCKPDEGGFSARNMWRGGGAVVQYVYWPDQPNTCGDDRYYKSDGSNVPFKAGTWMTVEHRVKMNTVGKSDGILEGWVDGKRYLNETSRKWRKTDAYAIDALYFSTFFGGGSQPWASPKEQTVDFDDLIVDDEPISIDP